MTILIIASLAFLLTHLGVSSTPLRAKLIGAIGQSAYLGLYSLLAAITLGFMIYGYINVPHSDFVWAPSKAGYVIAKLLMPLSLILIVSGLMTKNPTAVGQDDAVGQALPGTLKVTRHPVQWGILLWAIAHIASNGDVASLVFFGTFAVLSAVGMLAMDAKYRQREGDAWRRFFDHTSYLPFAAVMSGKSSLKINELNWIAIGIGVVLSVLIYVFHDWVGGVPIY